MAETGIKKTFSGLMAKFQNWRATELNSFLLYRTFLFYIGLWPQESDRHGIGALYRKWLPRFIYIMINYGMFIGFPVIIYQSFFADNIIPFMESLATIFAGALMYAHIHCLMFQTDRLNNIFVELDHIVAMGKRLPYRPVTILILNKRWTEFTVASMFICSGITGATGMYMIPKLYFARIFSFNEWYPFDTYKSPAFEILFALNAFRLVYLVIMMILLYMIVWGAFVEIVAQYRILSYNIDKVRRRSKKSRTDLPNRFFTRYADIGSEVDRFGVVVRDEVKHIHGARKDKNGDRERKKSDHKHKNSERTRKPRKEAKRRETDEEILKKCVQHHQSLIRFAHIVESTFEVILVMHIFCTLVPTGLGITMIMKSGGMEEKLMMILALIAACYLLLGVISLFADEITEQDEGIRDTMFGCDWLRASDSFKRSMRIIISYCNQPMVIMLAGCIPLNRANFFATMKLTYSYTMTMSEFQ